MIYLSNGDRVELANVSPSCPKGIVEHADKEHVRVRWDDSKIGLLYYDNGMIPNARYLLKLK